MCSTREALWTAVLRHMPTELPWTVAGDPFPKPPFLPLQSVSVGSGVCTTAAPQCGVRRHTGGGIREELEIRSGHDDPLSDQIVDGKLGEVVSKGVAREGGQEGVDRQRAGVVQWAHWPTLLLWTIREHSTQTSVVIHRRFLQKNQSGSCALVLIHNCSQAGAQRAYTTLSHSIPPTAHPPHSTAPQHAPQ